MCGFDGEDGSHRDVVVDGHDQIPSVLVIDCCGHSKHCDEVLRAIGNAFNEGNGASSGGYADEKISVLNIVTKYYAADVRLDALIIDALDAATVKRKLAQAAVFVSCLGNLDFAAIAARQRGIEMIESKAFVVVDSSEDTHFDNDIRNRLIDCSIEFVPSLDVSRLKQVLETTMWANMCKKQESISDTQAIADCVKGNLGKGVDYDAELQRDTPQEVNEFGSDNDLELEDSNLLQVLDKIRGIRSNIANMPDEDRRKAAEKAALEFAAAFGFEET